MLLEGTCLASLSSRVALSSHPVSHYFTRACMSVFLCRPLAGASVSPLHLVLVSQPPASLSFPSPALPEEGAAFFGRLVSKHIALIFHGCAFFLLLLLFSLSCVPPHPPPKTTLYLSSFSICLNGQCTLCSSAGEKGKKNGNLILHLYRVKCFLPEGTILLSLLDTQDLVAACDVIVFCLDSLFSCL